jgi:hypothetical protein
MNWRTAGTRHSLSLSPPPHNEPKQANEGQAINKKGETRADGGNMPTATLSFHLERRKADICVPGKQRADICTCENENTTRSLHQFGGSFSRPFHLAEQLITT